VRFVEMHRIREHAYCCGGGGGVPDAHPQVAQNATLQRVDEARNVGAEILVTACQHCRNNLTRWNAEPSIPVVDLVDLVYKAAGLGARYE
jgi:Fe-S oxidoreductase